MAVNLTTLVKVKQFLGLSEDQSDTDNLIKAIINGVSQQIAEYCDRRFGVTTYKKWFNGTGTYQLRLPDFPLRAAYQCSIENDQAGYATYSGGGTFASINLDSSSCTLVNTEADGTDTLTAITLAGKTITELSTSIDAQTGWGFTVGTGYSAYPASQLRPFSSGDAKNTSWVYFETPAEGVGIRVASNTDDVIEATECLFPCGNNNIFVWYKAGWTLPDIDAQDPNSDSSEVPKGLELIVHQICADVYQIQTGDTDRAMESERLGDYQYKIAGGVTTQFVHRYSKELSAWTRKSL